MLQKKLLNKIIIPLRWMDLDAYGHVGNSRYFDFMTDARVALLEEQGVLKDLSKQYVVVDAQCAFHSPVYYPGSLILEQYCEKIGNTSFTLTYRFYMNDAPDLICAEAYLVMVCYDAKLKKAVPLEPTVRNALGEN